MENIWTSGMVQLVASGVSWRQGRLSPWAATPSLDTQGQREGLRASHGPTCALDPTWMALGDPGWDPAVGCVTLREPFTPTSQSLCRPRVGETPQRETLGSIFYTFLECQHSSLRIPTFRGLWTHRS